MDFLLIIPVFIGAGMALQTAVNSKLRVFTQSPYAASAISFTVGAIFLTLLTVLNGDSLMISGDTVSGNPWWIWLGGLLGSIGLTLNILLFPRLGGIQTVVLPVFGQIIMGTVIDYMGLFGSPAEQIDFKRLAGILVTAAGVAAATGMLGAVIAHIREAGAEKRASADFSRNDTYSDGKIEKKASGAGVNILFWRVIGIFAGMVMAVQAAINGHLGVVLGSSVNASRISFTIGMAIMIAVTLVKTENVRARLKNAVSAGIRYWWIWTGGFLGSFYVLGTSTFVPIMGTGRFLVLVISGQLTFSAVIEHFGLLESPRGRVTLLRVAGIVIVFAGICIINM